MNTKIPNETTQPGEVASDETRKLAPELERLRAEFLSKTYADRRRFLETMKKSLEPNAVIDGRHLLPKVRLDFGDVLADLTAAHDELTKSELLAA